MATYNFNFASVFFTSGANGGYADSLDNTVTDGAGDNVFDTSDTLTNDWSGDSGPYVGTQTLNGTTFIFQEWSGGLYIGFATVPDGYVPFDGDIDPGAFDASPIAVCFAAGTRILTDRGEMPVESLRAGDLVATLGLGGAPFAPVLFVGQRRIALAGGNAALAPIRIRAGALGADTPRRDLLVSPDHCLLLNGALVPARLLVNGDGITVEQGLAVVTYFHIELPRHDAVLAEGAAAESWLDAGNRSWFANAPRPLLRVDGTLAEAATSPMTPCAPLVQGGARLVAIRDQIAARATPPMRRAA